MKGTAEFMQTLDQRKPQANPPLPMPRDTSQYVHDLCKAKGMPQPPDRTPIAPVPERDPILPAVAEYLLREGKASGAMVVKEFGVTRDRARAIIKQLEADGVVGPDNGNQPRTVVDDLDGTPFRPSPIESEEDITDTGREIIEVL